MSPPFVIKTDSNHDNCVINDLNVERPTIITLCKVLARSALRVGHCKRVKNFLKWTLSLAVKHRVCEAHTTVRCNYGSDDSSSRGVACVRHVVLNISAHTYYPLASQTLHHCLYHFSFSPFFSYFSFYFLILYSRTRPVYEILFHRSWW